jgi:hypothetical protein
MMERGFFPEEVERALVLHGIDAVQVDRGKAIGGPSDRGRTKNFTIRGTKLAEDVQTLLEYAKADHARHYGFSQPPETLSPAGIDEAPRNNGDARPTVKQAKPGTRKFAKKVLRRITGRPYRRLAPLVRS